MHKMRSDELDEQLKQLAIEAQQHPPLSIGRQLALTKLVNKIVQSGRLCHPYRGQFLYSYEEIYSEALQELLLYICQNIEKYDASRAGVMAWVNVLLERRFFKEAIPKVLDKQGFQRMDLADLDNIAPPERSVGMTEIIRECLELDPDNIFKKEHLENNPQANFQAVAQRRISGKSWKEISMEFDIKVPTVSSFYYRCLTKFSPKLKEYCLDNVI